MRPVQSSLRRSRALGAAALLGLSLSVLTPITAAWADVPPDEPIEQPEGDAATGGDGEGDGATEGGDEALPPTEPDPAPAEEPPAEEAAAALEAELSPWSFGLMMSMSALFIGGLSAVLGIWVDRDQTRPVIFAMVMSVLITAAIAVGATQSYLDAVGAIQQKQDLERMLGMVNEIAVASGDQSLANVASAHGGEAVEVPPPPPAEAPDTAAPDTEGSGDTATDEGAPEDGSGAEAEDDTTPEEVAAP